MYGLWQVIRLRRELMCAWGKRSPPLQRGARAPYLSYYLRSGPSVLLSHYWFSYLVDFIMIFYYNAFD